MTSLQAPNPSSSRIDTTTSVMRSAAQFLTPPSTPVQYKIKLADFGLAREITSDPPYTAYVSTRWYRAPEVLLRARHYSAPVDMWAFGALAAELATLNPLFPGKNEIEQIWLVCEVLGSPGDWRNRVQKPIGGGVWKDGAALAEELHFKFPKVREQSNSRSYANHYKTPPVAMEDILGPSWPRSLSKFVTELLYWDPRARLTSEEALRHEFLGLPQQSTLLTKSVDHRASIARSYQQPVSPDARRGIFRNMQQSLQRGPSIASTRSNLSHLAAGRNPDQRNVVSDAEPLDNPNAGTHRQSWFAKKRDSFIGRRFSVFVSDDVPANNTRSKAQGWHAIEPDESSNRTPSQPSSILGSSSDKNPGSLFLPLAPPISPLPDLTHATNPEWSLERNIPVSVLSEGQESRRPCQNQEEDSQSALDVPGVPERTLRPHNTRKMIRTISDYSSEPKSSPKNCQPQKAEPQGGLSGLFSHLRKKTKRSDQNQVTQSDALAAGDARETQGTKWRPAASLPGRMPPSRDTPKKGTRAIEKRRTSQSPGARPPVIHLSQSLPAMSTNMARKPSEHSQVIMSKNSKFPSVPQSSGPISSRTRKAFTQASKSSHPEVRDEEAELLEAALQSTAHAMEQLEAFPEPNHAVTRPVPSYAKSTASSVRRASNIQSVPSSALRSTNKRMIEHRIPFPPSPPQEDIRSPCAGYLAT